MRSPTKCRFLAHETRHFADAPKFPRLSHGPIANTAPKLTELALAQTSMDRLLAKFENQKAKTDAPHPLANWHVLNDIAQEIYDGAQTTDWIERVEHDRVRSAARKLLAEHTDKLNAMGAAQTTGVIRP